MIEFENWNLGTFSKIVKKFDSAFQVCEFKFQFDDMGFDVKPMNGNASNDDGCLFLVSACV